MSKSRRNYKWYDRNDDDSYNDDRKQTSKNRRQEKQLKNQLRAKNYDPRYFEQDN